MTIPTYTPEEQRAHRRLAAEALRSGEFEQVSGQLRTGTRYCCLGVMCEVFRRVTGVGSWNAKLDFVVRLPDGQEIKEHDYLSRPVAEFYGISCKGSYVPTEDEALRLGLRGRLANLADVDNDKLGRSFSAIADKIEAEPEGFVVDRYEDEETG